MKKKLEDMSIEELKKFEGWLRQKSLYVEFLIKHKESLL